MKKQYVVLGLGSFGYSVALTLENLGCDVIAVDRSDEKIQEVANELSFVMKANIEDPDVLKTLGARNLDGAIIAISEDLKASILATITAKEIGIPFVLAKAKTDLHATILKKVGADDVIYPEREMGSRVAKSLVTSNFADWIELSPDFSMVEREVPSSWVGRSLVDLKVRETYGINVVGIVDQGQVHVNIDPNVPLRQDLLLILIGANKALQKFKEA